MLWVLVTERSTLLRIRGGISSNGTICQQKLCSSPHTRRYFHCESHGSYPARLFSAYAEVFPPVEIADTRETTLLRIRGGISVSCCITRTGTSSSPHTRRYFRQLLHHPHRHLLFSAYAEVFPGQETHVLKKGALLRIRGGISYRNSRNKSQSSSSPHTRRYFTSTSVQFIDMELFSAYAEVFPRPRSRMWTGFSLLRIRGGISQTTDTPTTEPVSSPHTRRYFRLICRRMALCRLFSAYAEVFPPAGVSGLGHKSLLRIRGGISIPVEIWLEAVVSSPHTRRYFQKKKQEQQEKLLFSAYAEVFPLPRHRRQPTIPLLRIRGGISDKPAPRRNRADSSPHTRRYFPQGTS